MLTFGQGEKVTRLWDVATGQQRMVTAEQPGWVSDIELNHDGSLLMTASDPFEESSPLRIFFWNGRNGKLIRKLEFQDGTLIGTSPDVRSVLISRKGQVEVRSSDPSVPSKRLFEDDPIRSECYKVTFSPTGQSAVCVSQDGLRWWSTADWQLQQVITAPEWRPRGTYPRDLPEFIAEFIQEDMVAFKRGTLRGVWVKGSRALIEGTSKNLDKPLS